MFWSGKRAVARVGCRRVVMLAVALALPLVVAAQASPALAVSPQVTITCASPTNCTASGTGFTPSSQVQVQATAGTAVFSTSSLVASAPSRPCVTNSLGKPVCFEVGGGAFTAALPVDYGLICNATAAGTVRYTNVSSGAAVSEPVTWTGPCVQPTTTTLSSYPGDMHVLVTCSCGSNTDFHYDQVKYGALRS